MRKHKFVMVIAALALVVSAGMARAEIEDKKAWLGIELGPPLLYGPQFGYHFVPQAGVNAGFMQIGAATVLSFEGRYLLKPGNFRPYLSVGYTSFSVKDENEVTGTTNKGTVSLLSAGLGIEYAFSVGLSLGMELNYLKVLGFKVTAGDISESGSLFEEDLAVFLPNLQIRAYF